MAVHRWRMSGPGIPTVYIHAEGMSKAYDIFFATYGVRAVTCFQDD